MSDNEAQHIEDHVESVVSRYSARNLWAIIIAAFAAGVWATTLQIQVARLVSLSISQEQATTARVAAWTQWRETVEERLRASGGDRFTGTDYNTAVSIYNNQKPVTKFPYLWEIKKEQGK